MRKMKFGICIGRIEGVLRGLARWEAAFGKGDEMYKAHIALGHGKDGLSRSPSGHPDTSIIPVPRRFDRV